MYYVYLIYSKQYQQFYLGYSGDLRKRIKSHLEGLNKSTKKANDWQLVYYEAYTNKRTAMKREKSLKRSGKAYQSLKL